MDGLQLAAASSPIRLPEPLGAKEIWSYRSPAWKSPTLYVAVLILWLASLVWFHPRLWSLTSIGESWWSAASIAYFVLFAELAWLYGIYNVAIVAFAAMYRLGGHREFLTAFEAAAQVRSFTPVAVLYTTCNDFVEESAASCVSLNYPDYRVYILDDSSDPAFKKRIDRFAAAHAWRVTVVRRPSRSGAKAGNLNHALGEVVAEPLFAVVDADEILPANFLERLVPRLEADAACGFVQANHRARKRPGTQLARDMGIGIDIHWKWYQPLRNKYGFVMFLGHGALIRRSAWTAVGGFPEIVSEDLAFAIALRERGYHGFFAEDVICEEEFPESVRVFRVRHVKWTRGTCEFLLKWGLRLCRGRTITFAEKVDILMPTLNLPMTFFFFLFMLNAQFVIPFVLGEFRPLTIEAGGGTFVLPVLSMKDEMNVVFSWDFYAITLVTILAPMLCFIVELWRTPLRLFRFLAHSGALYAALSPLTFINVLGFAFTRTARFLVTGDANNGRLAAVSDRSVRARVARFWSETHPDSPVVRGFEFTVAIAILLAAVVGFQISLVGIGLGFLLLTRMHRIGWKQNTTRYAVYIPFTLMLVGMGVGGLGMFGMQTVFFGYGFHF